MTGENKVRVSRVLRDCNDLTLFEQAPIQHIIDYKWDTFGYHFFLYKFIWYFLFLVFYYIDIERGLDSQSST